MIFHSLLVFVFLFAYPSYSLDVSDTKEAQQRARSLKKFLQTEKADYDSRETQRKTLLESLDELNAKQNQVRQKLQGLTSHQQELEMSLDNLALEYQNQKKLEQAQRQRLFLLLKVVYKIQKEGISRFVFHGQNLSQLAGRVRVLLYTLRSHAQLTRQFQERTQKLAEAELKLKASKLKLVSLSDELKDQQLLLENLLKNKNRLVAKINEKQSSYRLASREYQRVSHQLSELFKGLPSAKTGTNKGLFEPKGDLPMPTEGTIVQGFGKSVHEKFGTVTYHKGIEIEADFNSPVSAVLPGGVEFAGWLRGLGNVIILHHGQGLYTLNAHLFKFNKEVGETVEAGDVIGFVGDTGNREKPSLYFEIRSQGKAVDPLAYLSSGSQSQLN
ncbi:MAG: murein hydrolase activator EnvC family protein [Pseudomonadota bacterium]